MGGGLASSLEKVKGNKSKGLEHVLEVLDVFQKPVSGWQGTLSCQKG